MATKTAGRGRTDSKTSRAQVNSCQLAGLRQPIGVRPRLTDTAGDDQTYKQPRRGPDYSRTLPVMIMLFTLRPKPLQQMGTMRAPSRPSTPTATRSRLGMAGPARGKFEWGKPEL